MRRTRRNSKDGFQVRYGVYLRDYGVTSDQMLALDKKCYPSALLTPYLLWTSGKWVEWGELSPGREIFSTREKANFDE